MRSFMLAGWNSRLRGRSESPTFSHVASRSKSFFSRSVGEGFQSAPLAQTYASGLRHSVLVEAAFKTLLLAAVFAVRAHLLQLAVESLFAGDGRRKQRVESTFPASSACAQVPHRFNQ
jgi:hypothetical protein